MNLYYIMYVMSSTLYPSLITLIFCLPVAQSCSGSCLFERHGTQTPQEMQHLDNVSDY